MIHDKLQPPPCAKSTFNPMWRTKSRVSHSICICCSAKSLPTCFYSSLGPSAPTNTSRDHRRGLSCSQWITQCGVGQEGRGRMKALKFLMRSLVFSLLNLYTSCLRQVVATSTPRYADKLPPLAPPHNLGCHHSRHVPRACFFPYLCGNMRDWFLCVYILLKIVFECWQGAVVKENWAPKYKNPASFLRVIVEPLIMQSLTLQSLCRPLTELVHTYLSILQEKAWVLPVVWVRHIFSLACMSFSHVFILKMTHFPLRSELYCCRCGARYRQLYEQWEHISAGITLQTGCGGGGGGFSLTDLSLQSHLFFGLSAPECSVSGWSSAHRIISGIFAKTSTTSYSEMHCLRIHTVQYVREMEEEDEVVGGWVGGVTRRWLVHPT